jgi:Taurine catabolism dioxygenase TauD, TfdA family
LCRAGLIGDNFAEAEAGGWTAPSHRRRMPFPTAGYKANCTLHTFAHHKMAVEFVPLHPTFGAEVRGVDFSKPISKDVADQIVKGADKYGVLVFRKTGMTDEDHIQFSKHFGDLDDISGFIPPGVRMSRRTRFLELFDASNLDGDGHILQEHEKRFQYNKVCHPSNLTVV